MLLLLLLLLLPPPPTVSSQDLKSSSMLPLVSPASVPGEGLALGPLLSNRR
jgi:hypothetical protein